MPRKKSKAINKVNKTSSVCHPSGWWSAKGIILLLFGILLWAGIWNLETVIALILVLAGIKYIWYGCGCSYG